MASLDQIVDRVREESGADFAFILTRRGRLATRNAPSDMPQEGRAALVELAEELLDSKRDFAHMELPRETLVPFGGAAPVDVYVAAREEAILCVVMATFVSQDRVGPAVARGVGELDALLDTDQRRLRRRGLKARPPNPKSSSGQKRRRTGEFTLDFDDEGARGTIPFLAPYKPAPKRDEPPPEITVRDASVGRATLAAIEVDAQSPEIVYGMSPIGRHTIAEIERSVVPEGDPKSSIPDIRVNVVTMPDIPTEELDVIDRQTLPFTENAAAAKRAFDAKESPPSEHPVTVSASAQRTVIVGRSGSGPRLKRSLRDERASIPDSDDTIPDAAPAGLRPPPPAPKRVSQSPAAPGKPRSIAPGARKSVAPRAASSAPPPEGDPMIESKEIGKDERVLRQLRDSNIEAWHQALGEIDATEGAGSSPPPPRISEAPPKRHTRPPSAAFPKRKTLSPPKRRDS